MVHHLVPFGVASLGRVVAEVLLGGLLLLVARNWDSGGWFSIHPGAKPVPGDREAFYALGALLVAVAVIRCVQAICSLKTMEWGRRLGMILACVDFVTPVTMPFAIWGLIIYRHPDTRDYFQRKGKPE
jgi:hypothetical protein